MDLREITNKEELEGFLSNCAEKTFLQSWNWGEFNISRGEKIWRIGVYENQSLLGVSSIFRVKARRGIFLFIPHGPVIQETLAMKDKKEALQIIFERVKDIAKEEGASFIRVTPIFEIMSQEDSNNEDIFRELGFRPAPMHSSAYEATWRLDIYPQEEELFRNMRKTTRYLIRKAEENKDIKIEKSDKAEVVSTYQVLNREVSRRQKFIPFSDEFVEKEFKAFAPDGQVLFLFGKYNGEVAAGAMIIFWSGVAFYHQAASLGKFAKLSIPYLLQWEAIKEAKRRGCKIYDFWGFTDPEKYSNHPWAGPTLFKMGFGGYKKEYVKTQDFIISAKYWLNYIIEIIRKKKRNL